MLRALDHTFFPILSDFGFIPELLLFSPDNTHPDIANRVQPRPFLQGDTALAISTGL
jgi:hypothetical protein